jgi:hypothetical protein
MLIWIGVTLINKFTKMQGGGKSREDVNFTIINAVISKNQYLKDGKIADLKILKQILVNFGFQINFQRVGSSFQINWNTTFNTDRANHQIFKYFIGNEHQGQTFFKACEEDYRHCRSDKSNDSFRENDCISSFLFWYNKVPNNIKWPDITDYIEAMSHSLINRLYKKEVNIETFELVSATANYTCEIPPKNKKGEIIRKKTTTKTIFLGQFPKILANSPECRCATEFTNRIQTLEFRRKIFVNLFVIYKLFQQVCKDRGIEIDFMVLYHPYMKRVPEK